MISRQSFSPLHPARVPLPSFRPAIASRSAPFVRAGSTLIIEAQPAEWEQIEPPNVLILPQRTVPVIPLIPSPTPNVAFIGSGNGNCGSGECNLLVHDANSGWWFLFASLSPCDRTDFGDCNCLSPQQYFQMLVDGTNPDTLQPFVLGCPKGADWWQPPGWTGCAWDWWTIVCSPITSINVEIQSSGGGGGGCPAGEVQRTDPAACPLGYQPSDTDGCCRADPPLPYGGAGPLIGRQLFSTDALPLIPTPLEIPIPTKSIAVTACQTCETADEEIEV